MNACSRARFTGRQPEDHQLDSLPILWPRRRGSETLLWPPEVANLGAGENQAMLAGRQRPPVTQEATMSDTDGLDVEDLIAAAQIASAGDPEQEIAALQELLRLAWGLMPERQQNELLETDEAQAVLEAEEDESEEPDAD